jgi:hypothetical protein
LIDDNFHFQDESERASHGTFATADEALTACRTIVDGFLADAFKPGMPPAALYEQYTLFGDDPWIASIDPNSAPAVVFSAWDYARKRCDEMAEGRGVVDL